MIRKKLYQISRRMFNINLYTTDWVESIFNVSSFPSAMITPLHDTKIGLSVSQGPVRFGLLLDVAKNNNYYKGSTLKYLSLFYLGISVVSRVTKRKMKDL